MRENRMYGLTRGSGDSFMVEIVWHRRETSRITEKTNLNLTMMSLTLLYRKIFDRNNCMIGLNKNPYSGRYLNYHNALSWLPRLNLAKIYK